MELRLDTKESAIFERELTYVFAEIYRIPYGELKAYRLLPIDSSVPSGIKIIEWWELRKTGYAKVIGSYTGKWPVINVYGKKNKQEIKWYGDSYNYTVQEIREMIHMNIKLDRERAAGCREVMDQTFNSIGFIGDANYGLHGIIGYPGVPEVILPDGESTDKDWWDKTPQEILNDLDLLVYSVIQLTNQTQKPDTVIMPTDQYRLIANTEMSVYKDRTILEQFLKIHPWVTNVEDVSQLEGAGGTPAAPVDMMMCYVNNIKNIKLVIPEAFEQHMPDKDMLVYTVPCTGTTAGVVMPIPLSAAFALFSS